MLVMWAISTTAEHANVSVRAWVRYKDDPEFDVSLESLRIFETEEKGIQGLKEFREMYDEWNYVPRSGLIRGSAEEWHLWRVEYHQHAERVDI